MPNEYSIEIHNYISDQIAISKRKVSENKELSEYYRGQLKELHWLRSYLKENIDLKDFKYYE